MKRFHSLGWLLAGVLALQHVAVGLAAPVGNPLEAHVLQHSTGALYVYHAGVKYRMDRADVGDAVIEAIPNASDEQWNTLFPTAHEGAATGVPQQGPTGPSYPLPSRQPQPFPGYS
jgi:hypothetical protein